MALIRQLFSKAVFSTIISKSLTRSNKLVKPVFLLRNTSTSQPLLEKKEVRVTFVRASGERIEAKGKVGDSLLDVVVNNEIDLSGFGACEGTLTCSTCHLILKPEDYDRLTEKPTDEEMDMLDLAYELTDTSRLGCQIILNEDLDGLEVKVPATINDARAD
ncbi:adrenodoxin-like protein 2, mitochondrial [Phymastichus coffea]|uniref:adrenodoxin-like protein 2, mitochondrial n=1 Tax=Phymastichus coffea TaxID=108790 RepID=UPI00273C62BC|nr:adrenodoxin-like protein 2, mitochondrial [Phymastichus coffea]